MMQSDQQPLDTPLIRAAIKKIEDQNVKILDVVAWLRVLSVHPPPSGDVADGVVFRLGLRPVKESDAVVVNNQSLAARLYEVGISIPIDPNRNMDSQVDQLISTIKQDAPRALELSKFPRVVTIPTPTRAVDLVAAVISLVLTMAVAWVYQVVVAGWALPGAARAVEMAVSALLALAVYLLVASRFPRD